VNVTECLSSRMTRWKDSKLGYFFLPRVGVSGTVGFITTAEIVFSGAQEIRANILVNRLTHLFIPFEETPKVSIYCSGIMSRSFRRSFPTPRLVLGWAHSWTLLIDPS